MASVIPEIRNLAIRTSKNIKWHVIASIAFAGSHAVEEVAHVLRHSLQNDANGDIKGDLARRIAREIRDGLTKAATLIGAANALDALAELSTIQPLAEDDPSPRTRETDAKIMSSDQIRARGWEYWKKIYGSRSEALLDEIHRGYPDAAYWAVSHVYGPMFSFFDCLDEMQTSFVMIASLIPGGHNKQLRGHYQGALNNGATREEVQVVREIAIRVCLEVGIKWKTSIIDL